MDEPQADGNGPSEIDALKDLQDTILQHSQLDPANPTSFPTKAYLDAKLMPLLIEGLRLVVKERPSNPTEWLALFLLKNSKN